MSGMVAARMLELVVAVTLGAALLALLALLHVLRGAARRRAVAHADVAVVLGAAVHEGRPSPVFAGRITHGVSLLECGMVDLLIFTGGQPPGCAAAESEIAAEYARTMGVEEDRIRVERRSTSTWTNLIEAIAIMEAEGKRSMLVVSDPMHMSRAMAMASSLGVSAAPAPTPVSGVRGPGARARFAVREALALVVFWVLRARGTGG